MLRRLARRLPPPAQERLGAIWTAARSGAPAALPAPEAPAHPTPLSIEDLTRLVKQQSELDAQKDQRALDAQFGRTMLRPELYRALDLEYATRTFGEAPAFKRLCAARALGQGRVDAAFETLRALAEQSGTLFDTLMAARCLMRPAGAEQQLLEYMLSVEDRFGNEPHFYLNLATCHFVLGQTSAANEILDRHRPEWEQILQVRSPSAEEAQEELATAISSGDAERRTPFDDTYFTEAGIWPYWEQYYTDMNLDPPSLMFGWLRSAYERYLEEITDPSASMKVVDFGVMCAQPHFAVAAKHPNATFVGIDRQQATADLNARAFGDRTNLDFVAGEIEDLLRGGEGLAGGALFHARTATLVYPQKMRNVYRLAHDAGIETIALFENLALSRSAARFLDYDDFERESETFKNFQFIHAYPQLLEDAGYTVERETRLFSPLVSPLDTEDLCSTHVHLVARKR